LRVRLIPYIGILCVIALDHLTKWAVIAWMDVGESFPVVSGFFDICSVRNQGAAWGILHGWRWILLVIAALMLGLLVQQRREFFNNGWLGKTAFCLLTGGIIGNVIDRILWGHVVDFIHVYWRGTFDFPAFNIADSAICIGAALYLLTSLRPRAPVAQSFSG